MDEAPAHPHNRARGTYVEREGIVQPGPAPRFSATPGAVQGPPPEIGQHTREALLDWGFAGADVDALVDQGAI
jgi:alpha-methylacyl-CoA racemase